MCGCDLLSEYQQCPQCGYMSEEARAVHVDTSDRPPRNMRIAVFILGLLAVYLLTVYIGTYMLFLFFPIMFVKGYRSLAVTFFDGALVGAFLGLLTTYLI